MGDRTDSVPVEDRRTTDVHGPPVGAEPDPPPGGVVGRYRVRERIGAGGMGVVYAAEDPELQRRIAIKFLRRHGRGREQNRILGEARALARINHPNVLRVFDVGEHDGRVYLVVELVGGSTLAEWLAKPRSWAEVIQAFAAAGRGLAEAHRQGIVHRDFKPGNVLRGEDGRILVMDFGIATADDVGSTLDAEGTTHPAEDRFVLGTPAYMAPEQLRGGEVDARADQFSFCVALYHALYGAFPFPSKPNERSRAVSRGEVTAAVRGDDVPAAIRPVIMRGLAPLPANRWPTMEALLDRLVPRRRKGWALAAVIVGAGGLASAALLWPDPRPGCGIDELARTWEQHHGEARGAFAASKRGHADDSFRLLEAQIDGYVETWTRAQEDACALEQGRARDVRLACLSARAAGFVAFAEGIGAADAAFVDTAVLSVGNLEPVDTCGEAERPGELPTDPEAARAVFEIRRELAEATGLSRAGRYDAAMPKARHALQRATEIHDDALLARAAEELGHLQYNVGEHEASAETLERGVVAATASGRDAIAARTAAHLALVLAVKMHRYDEAERWFKHAESAMGRVDNGLRVRRDVLNKEGAVANERADFAHAAAKLERAAEMTAELEGVDSAKYATSLLNLANAYAGMGELDRAETAAKRGIEITKRAVGPKHPWVANGLGSLGAVAMNRGRVEEALPVLDEAVELYRVAYGPDHAETAAAEANLGLAFHRLGRHAEALERLDRAIAIIRSTLGESHPNLALTLNMRGTVRAKMGDLDGARRDHEKALRIQEDAAGAGHVRTADSLASLGIVMAYLQRYDDAEAYLQRALTVQQAAVAPDHPAVASLIADMAVVASMRGDDATARIRWKAALDAYEAAGVGDHPRAVEIREELARPSTE